MGTEASLFNDSLDDGMVITEEKPVETVHTGVGENQEEAGEKVDDKVGEKQESQGEEKPVEKAEEKPEEPEEKPEDNPFSLKTDVPVLRYSDIGKDIELDLPDSATKEDFVNAYKTKIEEARQKVVPDISGWEQEAQDLFHYLNDGNSVADFIEPLRVYDNLIMEPAEEKVKIYLMNAERMTEEEAKTKVSQLVEEERLDRWVQDVDRLIQRNKQGAIQDILEQNKRVNAERRQKAEASALQERNALKQVIAATTVFEGLNIPKETIDAIIKDVDSGGYDKYLNNPKAQHEVYLRTRFADKVREYNERKLKEAKRDGYNEADRKNTEKLHNTKPIIDSASGHHNKGKVSGPGLAAENFQDIDF